MDAFGLSDSLLFAAQAANATSGWRETWPFGPGYVEGWISTVLKFGLIAVIFLLIALLLRFLFGPGGFLRDAEFDTPAAPADPVASDTSGPDAPGGEPRAQGGPHA